MEGSRFWVTKVGHDVARLETSQRVPSYFQIKLCSFLVVSTVLFLLHFRIFFYPVFFHFLDFPVATHVWPNLKGQHEIKTHTVTKR